MKTFITLIRWTVGLLFIFSGLIKANDPLGLSYKMQEFFEVWGMHFMNPYTLGLSLLMNIFEVLAGVALIIGWQMKWFSALLLLLIIFFTFLTGYALFSGKIKTCGCFGDCLPLTPTQSFIKDLVLWAMIVIIRFSLRSIQPIFSARISLLLLTIAVVGTAAAQAYVLRYSPFVDCLPYRQGNNLLEKMKTPPGAIPDSFAIDFTYLHQGKKLTFDADHFPDNFDSTYEFVERTDRLVKKGNGLQAAISDFSLQTLSGTDTTSALLNGTGTYLLVLAQNCNEVKEWKDTYIAVREAAEQKGIKVFLVTAESAAAESIFAGHQILKGDATVIKTAARVVPTYFLMEGANIRKKLAGARVQSPSDILPK
jgi:uncharacterized membrane protein YphA (DoxX/SURF4 family)